MNGFKNFLESQLRDGLSSLGDLYRKPYSSLMILLVIGISLAIPFSFLCIIKNLSQWTDNLNGQTQITLFLKTGASAATAEQLKQGLSGRAEISKINLVSPETALASLTSDLNIQDALDALPNNPLPWVLILQLSPNLSTVQNTKPIEQLLAELQALPEVEKAVLDLLWLKRLASAIHLAEHFITALALLLSLGILLGIGNTLNLYIENRREDIEILKLIGATDGFVRRPFLYLGIWYGVIGAILAGVIVALFMFWLNRAGEPLFQSYQSHFLFKGLDISNMLSLITLGLLLGFAAAWLSVSRHLRSLKAI